MSLALVIVVVLNVDIFNLLILLHLLPLLGRQVKKLAGGVVHNPDTDGADQRHFQPGDKENLQPEVSILINNGASTHRDQSSAKILESLGGDRLLLIVHWGCIIIHIG